MTTLEHPTLPLPECLSPVAAFVRDNVHRFETPPNLETLEAALCVHLANRSLFLTAERGTLTGACVLWETTVAHLHECEAAERAVFDWTPPQPGDCVYCLALVTTTDEAMRELARNIVKRFPHYRRLPLYAHRHGRLVNQRNLLERLTAEPLTPALSPPRGEGGQTN